MSYKDLYNKLNKKVIYAAALSIIGTILSLILIISATNVNAVSIANPIANTGNVNPVSISQTEKEEENNIIPLDQIVSGGPPPDGIPSIDNPKFIPVQEANKYLEGSELVLGLNINGDVRAYPLQILVWHEIVNDNVGGIPVAIRSLIGLWIPDKYLNLEHQANSITATLLCMIEQPNLFGVKLWLKQLSESLQESD